MPTGRDARRPRCCTRWSAPISRHGWPARPPLSLERLGRLNETTLVYSLRRPTVDGRNELLLPPEQLLDLLSQLVTPPRLHKHRFCGVLAPNAALRAAVTSSAGPAGARLQLLEQARQGMGPATEAGEAGPKPDFRRKLARCWALLLVRTERRGMGGCFSCPPIRARQPYAASGPSRRAQGARTIEIMIPVLIFLVNMSNQ